MLLGSPSSHPEALAERTHFGSQVRLPHSTQYPDSVAPGLSVENAGAGSPMRPIGQDTLGPAAPPPTQEENTGQEPGGKTARAPLQERVKGAQAGVWQAAQGILHSGLRQPLEKPNQT